MMLKLPFLALLCQLVVIQCFDKFIINTWSGPFEAATAEAFDSLENGGSPLDAIEAGCKKCENNQCDGTVGYGNHPDTSGHSSLDAMIMDGDTFDMGCVGYLTSHRQAISIARAVMYYTSHTMLVGQGAEDFADMIGFPRESVTTEASLKEFTTWQAAQCQPNFYDNIPAAKSSCGPYPVRQEQTKKLKYTQTLWAANQYNHDTIGMVALAHGSMACGTSTNGANHKISGRVGDSPIPGAGCYADSAVGGAAATGDGDVMMRFLPSYTAVLLMQMGSSPQVACTQALENIARKLPSFSGGIVCVNNAGVHAGAAHNMSFAYSYMSDGMDTVQVVQVA